MVTGARSLLIRMVALERECASEEQAQMLWPAVQTAAGYCLVFASSLRLRLQGKAFELHDANCAMQLGMGHLLNEKQLAELPMRPIHRSAPHAGCV
jgi:hypothetical protein|eukprot:6925659-Prymnesium_polylepis.1